MRARHWLLMLCAAVLSMMASDSVSAAVNQAATDAGNSDTYAYNPTANIGWIPTGPHFMAERGRGPESETDFAGGR